MLNSKVLKCLLREHVICHYKWTLSGLAHVTKNSGIKGPPFIPLLFKVTEVDGAATCRFIHTKTFRITYENYMSCLDMETSFLIDTEASNSRMPSGLVFKTLVASSFLRSLILFWNEWHLRKFTRVY